MNIATLLLIVTAVATPVMAIIYFLADYVVWAICGQDIPWYGDLVVALILNGVLFPTAAVLWVFDLVGGVLPIVGNYVG